MQDKFLQIYNLYKNDIYRLAYSYTTNFSESEDILQNVFIKLYKNEKILINDNIDIKKWLIRVTINECKTLFLSAWKRKIIPLDEYKEPTTNEREDNEILSYVINLPAKYRIIVFLYYYENY